MTTNPQHIKRKIFTAKRAKQTTWEFINYFIYRVYSFINPMALYVFILLAGLFSYEVVPFNEEFIAVMSIFFAFITIDKFASNILKSVFQEEQQTMFLFMLRKSYNAFSLSLLQRDIEHRVSAHRRYKKLLAYSFLFNILFLYNYFDVIMHDEVELEDILDLNIEESSEEDEYLDENEAEV